MQTNRTEENEQIRCEVGRGIALLLTDALYRFCPDNDQELFVIAERIKLCNENINSVIVHARSNKNNNPYSFGQRLWRCNSRLCPSCLALHSQRNRKTLRQQLLQQPPLRVNERWSFLTLTVPNLGLPLLKISAIVQLAWSLFRKRKFWKTVVSAAAKSEEFTVTRNGIHWHIHCLVRRRWWQYAQLRYEWTHCVRVAFERFNCDLQINTNDGMLLVVDKPIQSFASVTNELCKYITKSSSFRMLSGPDLIAFASIVRWPRMFELTGTLAVREGLASDVEGARKTSESGTQRAILDTTQISDGSIKSWRDKLTYMTARDLIYHLHDAVKRTREFRKRGLREKFGEENVTELPYETHRTFEDALDAYTDLFERSQT